MKRQEGMVNMVKPAPSGYGFIQPDDGGDELFFHYTMVEGSFEALSPGDKVSFEVMEHPEKGLRAVKVVKHD